jgi:hypothetical protein
LTTEVVANALQSIEDQQQELPQWLTASFRGNVQYLEGTRRKDLLSAWHVTQLLLLLGNASEKITSIFTSYATAGRMSLPGWLAFIHTEQLALSGERGEAHASAVQDPLDEGEKAFAQSRFEHASSGNVARTDATAQTITMLQFSLQLLSPQNNAVAPTVTDDLDAPFTHSFTACSHNSYIIGDQLTGLSSADACKSCASN